MIEVGNTVITAITVGSITPNPIDVGNTQVWPDSTPTTYYIVLTPTTVQAWNGYQRTDYISVSSNTNNWTVEYSANPYSASPYFTAVKSGNTAIQWHMDENTGTTSRVGYVTARYGDVSAQTVVYQNAGYYVYVQNTSPAVVGSASTTLSVSVISRYGNTAVSVTSALTGSDWIHCTGMTDVGGGQYMYYFTVDANPNTYTRYNGITFTQTQGSGTYKSATLSITQNAKYQPAVISGFTVYSYYGDWQLGRFQNGTVTTQGVQPLNAMAILRTTPPERDYTATYDIGFYYYAVPPPISNSIASTRQITACTNTSTCSARVDIPSGDTAYGFVITQAPNLTITGGTFSVV